MKKRFLYAALILGVLFVSSCSQSGQEDEKTVARINDFNLSLTEFHSELAAELEMEDDLKLTRDARKEFLDSIIRKELLIQEAQKLDLDKNASFMKAIERYWEATLIKDLMELKGKDISKVILVSQEEINAYYEDMKKTDDEVPPFEEVEQYITDELREMKKTRELRKWIEKLRKEAEISIDEELLYQN